MDDQRRICIRSFLLGIMLTMGGFMIGSTIAIIIFSGG
jgi:hypothetical protein